MGAAVDPTFTMITSGPIVSDVGNAMCHTWGDYDNDGFIDLVVANGIWNTLGGATAPKTNLFLYHSNGDGTFTRITNSPMTTLKADANAAAFGDYDNDGFLDLLVAIRGIKPNLILWHNNGDGAFTQMTNSPLATDQVIDCFGVSWVDCNNDGLLDAFVTAYLQGAAGNDHLYRNNGDGTFTSLNAAEAGSIVTDQSGTVAPAWTDYDNDGWPDLVVPIDVTGTSVSDILYRNLGQGTFSRVADGIIGRQGGPSMSGSWGDYDNDGWPDLFVTSDSGGRSHLYHNLQNGQFEEVTAGPLVHDTGWHSYTGCWGDYDNDGFLDLYVAKIGHSFLYHNNGDGTFTTVTTGSIATDTGNCATSSWVDYDNDGFLDLFVGHGSAGGGQISRLYHNNGNAHAWPVVKPVGTKSNRSVIGAKVRVLATYAGAARTQLREIGCTESWKGPNLEAHFGLGDATNVTTLRIEWPSGTVQELQNVAPKQSLTIWEPPALQAAVREDGACVLTMTAEPNRSWRIEGSSDLKTWQNLATVNNPVATGVYTDHGLSDMICRFYRIVSD